MTALWVWVACTGPTDRLGEGSGDSVSVLIASREVPAGATIDASDLQVQLVHRHDVPQDVISEPAEAIGHASRHRILVQEPIRRQALVQPTPSTDSADGIPVGMRAVRVPAGGLQPAPGVEVDVWWTPPGLPRPCIALGAIRVHAAGNDSATLLASPVQALELLSLATQPTLRITARAPGDDAPVPEAACTH